MDDQALLFIKNLNIKVTNINTLLFKTIQVHLGTYLWLSEIDLTILLSHILNITNHNNFWLLLIVFMVYVLVFADENWHVGMMHDVVAHTPHKCAPQRAVSATSGDDKVSAGSVRLLDEGVSCVTLQPLQSVFHLMENWTRITV